MTLPVPASAGQTVTTTIKVGIGKTNKLYYYLPDLTRTYTIIRTALPFWQMYASTAGKQSLYSNLSGATPTGTSVYELKLYPSYGTFNSGSTSLTLALTDTIVQMYPTYDEYRVTQLRWTVGGTVYVYNSSGTLLNSWTFSQVLAASGTGAYNMTIPLSTAALDGYQYKIELNSFGTTQISNL